MAGGGEDDDSAASTLERDGQLGQTLPTLPNDMTVGEHPAATEQYARRNLNRTGPNLDFQ